MYDDYTALNIKNFHENNEACKYFRILRVSQRRIYMVKHMSQCDNALARWMYQRSVSKLNFGNSSRADNNLKT